MAAIDGATSLFLLSSLPNSSSRPSYVSLYAEAPYKALMGEQTTLRWWCFQQRAPVRVGVLQDSWCEGYHTFRLVPSVEAHAPVRAGVVVCRKMTARMINTTTETTPTYGN